MTPGEKAPIRAAMLVKGPGAAGALWLCYRWSGEAPDRVPLEPGHRVPFEVRRSLPVAAPGDPAIAHLDGVRVGKKDYERYLRLAAIAEIRALPAGTGLRSTVLLYGGAIDRRATWRRTPRKARATLDAYPGFGEVEELSASEAYTALVGLVRSYNPGVTVLPPPGAVEDPL